MLLLYQHVEPCSKNITAIFRSPLQTPLTPDLSHSQGLLLQLGRSLCYQLVNGFECLGKRCLQIFVGRLELLIRLLDKFELGGRRGKYFQGEEGERRKRNGKRGEEG